MPATATPREPSAIDEQLMASSSGTQSDFWKRVEQWKRKVAEFFKVYERLQQAAPLVAVSGDPQLAEDYQTQIDRGGYIESTINAVQSTIDSVRAKLSQAADIFDGNLGVAPIIFLGAIGLITGGLATIGFWLSSSYDLMKRLEAEADRQANYEKLRAEGLSHGAAVQVLEATRTREPASWLENIGGILGLVLIGGVIYMLTRGSR